MRTTWRTAWQGQDIVIYREDQEVDRVSSLQRIVRMRRVGDRIPVEVMRFGTKKRFEVKLVEAENTAQVAAAPASPDAASNPAAAAVRTEFTGGWRTDGRSGGWVYLVDPHGNLVLRYAADGEAGGMLKDLTRLLKLSQIG